MENYRQALALLSGLPESSKRDLRELELTQSVVRMLQMTRAYSAPETTDAIERAAALADKSGNLKQLVTLMISRDYTAVVSGDLAGARILADQALDLAVREGSSTNLGLAHIAQIHNHYFRGDLAGAEKHFTAALVFFDEPEPRQFPGAGVLAFGYASWNSWALGKADSAREREARMMAIANGNNAYDRALSG